MKKSIGQLLLVISGMLFLAGMICILFSTDISRQKGKQAIRNNGGSIETTRYNQIVASNLESYRIAGSIIAVIGGAGLITIGGIMYHEWEE